MQPQIPQPEFQVPPTVAWYHRKWFVVLTLLFVFPVGLGLLWTSPVTKRSGRIAWTIIVAVSFVVWLANRNAPPPAISPASTASSQPAPKTTDTKPADTNPAATPAPSKSAPTWQVVKTWKGSGIKDTETIDIKSSEWRVSWKTSNQNIAGILQIMVMSEKGDLISLAANQQGVGADTSYVRAKPGRYYLKINSANVDWEVTVEDQR